MITARLKKRGTITLIVYFLLITAICAPLAFLAGRGRGQVEAEAGVSTSQNEPDLRADYAALYRARRAGAGCGGESDPDTERRAVWEIICHPYREGDGVRIAGFDPAHVSPNRAPVKTANAPSRKRGPLDNIMLASLAEDGPQTGAETGSPLSLAMAPDGGIISEYGYQGHTMSGGFGSGGFGDGPFGGPNAPGGPPGNLIPNIETVVNTPTPPTMPPVVETPVPAAGPLLLTGIAGFFLASRRRKRA